MSKCEKPNYVNDDVRSLRSENLTGVTSSRGGERENRRSRPTVRVQRPSCLEFSEAAVPHLSQARPSLGTLCGRASLLRPPFPGRLRKSKTAAARLLLRPLPSDWTVPGSCRGAAPVRLRLRLSPLRLPLFVSPPPPPPALEFRLILPPPPSSASSPQTSRRLRRKPKHKHSSPSAGATSAARRRPLRHVAARSELRLSSLPPSSGRPLHPLPRPFSKPGRPGLACGAGWGVPRDLGEQPRRIQLPPTSHVPGWLQCLSLRRIVVKDNLRGAWVA
ncbi:serine/arginine repetitive matrix protein 1-like [Hyaena hyaena]|uniref:serine/arginine repetitive matrix protein 1-like n=1 Tax=Hyaena hyaena TaxID=95912 RepID=UPI0019208B5C|nr:serine/arginine repetitive matrix protein 1-like [Hyaena hyaena]